jgi:hypothetical protein
MDRPLSGAGGESQEGVVARQGSAVVARSNLKKHHANILLWLSAPFCRSLLWLSRSMGLIAEIAGPLATFTQNASLPTLIAAGTASFIVLAVVLNVLSQVLLRNPNEPPMVFHFFPVIGSTVTYGMDPYKFFFDNKAKVRNCRAVCKHRTLLTGA